MSKPILLFMLFTLLTFNLTAKIAKDAKIGIIGGGIGGLMTAYDLQKNGYHNFTVWEKDDRVGGKMWSYKAADQQLYEIGAVITTSTTNCLYELSDELGVPKEPLFEAKVVGLDNEIYPYERYFFQNAPLMSCFKALKEDHILSKDTHPETKTGYFNADEKQFQLFSEFSQKMGISFMANMFRPFWEGCGYGPYEEVAAIYPYKLLYRMRDAVKNNLWSRLTFQEEDHVVAWTKGFQAVANAMADHLINPVRLSSEVVKIERNGKGGTVTLANGQKEDYDYLIFTLSPKKLPALLGQDQLTAEESWIAQSVEEYNYYVTLFEGKDLPAHKALFFAKNNESKINGRVQLLMHPHKNSNLFVAYQLMRWEDSEKDVINLLQKDMQELGGSVEKVILTQPWSYFPHVSPKALQEGFYQRLEKIQGEKNTFFSGGIMNMETVNYTAEYSRYLIENYFLN